MAIIFFDVETTGLNPDKDDIIQLSAIKYNDYMEQEDVFSMEFSTEVHIPEEVSKIHGLTNESLANMPPFKTYAKFIHDFFDQASVAGYNVMFDLRFLTAQLGRECFTFNTPPKIIDVFEIYKKYEPRSLSAVYERMTGTPLVNAHNSLADVKATVEVYKRLRGFIAESGKSIEDLSETHNLCDFSKKFVRDENGTVVFNFGKYYKKPALHYKDYLNWMLLSEFTIDTKIFINNLLKENK